MTSVVCIPNVPFPISISALYISSILSLPTTKSYLGGIATASVGKLISLKRPINLEY